MNEILRKIEVTILKDNPVCGLYVNIQLFSKLGYQSLDSFINSKVYIVFAK